MHIYDEGIILNSTSVDGLLKDKRSNHNQANSVHKKKRQNNLLHPYRHTKMLYLMILLLMCYNSK